MLEQRLAAANRTGAIQRRYTRADLAVFTNSERARFAPDPDADPGADVGLAFELLYRLEPDLYDRLVRAERLHPGIAAWLPSKVGRIVEVGAGTGRLTVDLLDRSDELVAIEPVASMRQILSRRLGSVDAAGRVTAIDGFFDALPVADAWADLVVTCSALTNRPAHGGETGLAEMARVCKPGGMVAVIWPNHLDWLTNRGFTHVVFGGPMAMEFESPGEAVELASVFFPDAVGEVRRRAEQHVPYDVLGRDAPRDLAYRRVEG